MGKTKTQLGTCDVGCVFLRDLLTHLTLRQVFLHLIITFLSSLTFWPTVLNVEGKKTFKRFLKMLRMNMKK